MTEMMIMVIQSLDCPERNAVLTQLSHLNHPKPMTIDVSFVPNPQYRVERLKILLHRSSSVLNVVIGANSKEEIEFLRTKQALFCNVHRCYPNRLLSIEGAISKRDVLISASGQKEQDVEVLSPTEAFSECFMQYKRRVKRAKELSYGH